MSILDAFKGLLGNGISPGTERTLTAIPELLGAWETGRGRPLGPVLSTLGSIMSDNASYRQAQANLPGIRNTLSKLINAQNAPFAYQELQALTPSINSMDPESATKELQRIQSLGEKEALESAKTRPISRGIFPDGTPYMFNGSAPAGQNYIGVDGQPLTPDQVRSHAKPKEQKISSSRFAADQQVWLSKHPNDLSGAVAYATAQDDQRNQQRVAQDAAIRAKYERPERDRIFPVNTPTGTAAFYDYDTGKYVATPGLTRAEPPKPPGPTTPEQALSNVQKAGEIAKSNLTKLTGPLSYVGMGGTATPPMGKAFLKERAKVLQSMGMNSAGYAIRPPSSTPPAGASVSY